MRFNFNLYRINSSLGLGRERLTIRGFKTSEAMYRELARDEHSLCNPSGWRECTYGFEFVRQAKPGVYVKAGGEWRNVKSLDASTLAHI